MKTHVFHMEHNRERKNIFSVEWPMTNNDRQTMRHLLLLYLVVLSHNPMCFRCLTTIKPS